MKGNADVNVQISKQRLQTRVKVAEFAGHLFDALCSSSLPEVIGLDIGSRRKWQSDHKLCGPGRLLLGDSHRALGASRRGASPSVTS